MVKIERCPTAPASLAKKSGSYKQEDVVDQLYIDFHGKCYICESKPPETPEVEHLLPHHNGKYPDRKYDWNNLFLVCRRCNGIKNRDEFEELVVDCCRIDPEDILSQKYDFESGHIVVSHLVDSAEARATAKLIQDCFECANTPLRKRVQREIAKKLKDHMLKVRNVLDEYEETQDLNHLYDLAGYLDRSCAFAGFTRTYVRQYLTTHPELAPLITL